MAYTAVNKAASFHSDNIWDGTGSSQTISCGFQPDITWVKCRNQAYSNRVADSARGYTKTLITNSTAAENASAGTVMSGTTSDGFTVVSDAGSNNSGDKYVGWSWKAGTTTGLTGGTITPTAYSISTTAGQSVIAYTGNVTSGATIPHGLGVTPQMIIIKNLTDVDSWVVYHESLGNTKFLELDTNGAVSTATNRFNDTSPTSAVFSVGDSGGVNGSGKYLIAYCFATIQGYSKFGTYTGNGNADDGPFIYTGFRPAFLICKRTDGANNWKGTDDKRQPNYNLNNKTFNLDTAGVESTEDNCDYLSNGFKLRRNGNDVNGSGYTYIYAAFSEFPIVSSNDVPTVAR